MYLRTVKTRGGAGGYWENGRARQRIVANLGRKDLLAPRLEALVRLLQGERAARGRGRRPRRYRRTSAGPQR